MSFITQQMQVKPKERLSPKKTFDRGYSLTKHGLSGAYTVKVIRGPFRLIPVTNWFKYIRSENDQDTGVNFINNTKSGHFSITYAVNQAVLKYENRKNKDSFWYYMKDYVRSTVNPHIFIGKIFMKIFGKYRSVGYFTLTKVIGEKE